MNTFGRLLRLSTWGESHGEAIGGVLDGFPAGFVPDLGLVQLALERRAPGRSVHTSPRREGDQVQFLSGLFEGKTTGAPISFIIYNSNQRSRDYEALRDVYRPGHADLSYQLKYGHRDHRGGGRSSARETAMRVVAGELARQWLRSVCGLEIYAYADSIGLAERASDSPRYPYTEEELRVARTSPLACPNEAHSGAMLREIEAARAEGDSVGGIIACQIYRMPIGLGEPIYDKLEARLASAMLSINACRAFELGAGFEAGRQRASVHNDTMGINTELWQAYYHSNNSGGVLGGISTGQTLAMRMAFKPAPSISRPQASINRAGEEVQLSVEGRHDPSVIPRAIPVVEAMCALVLMDMYLLNLSSRHDSMT